MNNPHRCLDEHALREAERGYRLRLTDEPGDMVTRVSLAWCLFLQAMHQAGQENTLAVLDETAGGRPAPLNGRTSRDHETRRLLQDCLRQAMIVRHLSRSAEERSEMERLQSWVRLSGGREALLL